MLRSTKHEEAPPTLQHPLSPMGEACSRMDLTAIHQILVTIHYRDDEGTNEVKFDMQTRWSCLSWHLNFIPRDLCEFGLVQLSFQEWTQQMRDMLEARKHGDHAFRDKDFKTAIDFYSQVQSLISRAHVLGPSMDHEMVSM